MEQAKIDRINELARKAKSEEGLTPAEMVERQKAPDDYITLIQIRRTQRENGDLERMVQLQREKKGYGGTRR